MMTAQWRHDMQPST